MSDVKGRAPVLAGQIVLVGGKGGGAVGITHRMPVEVITVERQFGTDSRGEIGHPLILPVDSAGFVEINGVASAVRRRANTGEWGIDIARAELAVANRADVIRGYC